MVIIKSKFQVPSTYSFIMVEKWHVRGNSIDNRQYLSIAWGKTGAQRWCKGTKKKVRRCMSASYIILAKIKLFLLFLKWAIVSTSILISVEINLHSDLPNFRHVSNTSTRPIDWIRLKAELVKIWTDSLEDLPALSHTSDKIGKFRYLNPHKSSFFFFEMFNFVKIVNNTV